MRAPVFLVVTALVFLAGSAAATTYQVGKDYESTDTLATDDLWHTYEFTAASGQTISYSYEVTNGSCASFFILWGHGVTAESEYAVDYSQENCAKSYSKNFPVTSQDGTKFTILVFNDNLDSVTYDISIHVRDSPIMAILPWIVLVVLIVVVIVVIAVLRGRRKRAAMAPMPMGEEQPPKEGFEQESSPPSQF